MTYNTFDGKQGHKLDDWLADVENAAAIVEEDEVVVAKGNARGMARDLIKNTRANLGITAKNNFATA